LDLAGKPGLASDQLAGRNPLSEPWYRSGVPRVGDMAMLAPTDLSVGIVVLGCSDGAAAYEEERSSTASGWSARSGPAGDPGSLDPSGCIEHVLHLVQ
jgi:hypothetical protein